MKVCTDSCLFGAWIAGCQNDNSWYASSILDAGSGTGLLALMLAQKTIAKIEAIEIDNNSFDQSLENIGASIFHDQIKVFHGDMFAFHYPRKYDLIVCNPPFFINQLKSGSVSKSKAMHNDAGNFKQIFKLANDNLIEKGVMAIMVMYDGLEEIISWANERDLFPSKIARIQHSPTHVFTRAFILFEKQESKLVYENICIRSKANDYTSAFKKLLSDFYLSV